MNLKDLRVRRIITGHNADGQAVIAADEELAGAGLAEDTGPRRRHLLPPVGDPRDARRPDR